MFGVLALIVQSIICLGATAIGLWCVVRPKHIQSFINSNFSTLPAVKGGMTLTSVFLRVVGIFLLWFAYTYAVNVHNELLALKGELTIKCAADTSSDASLRCQTDGLKRR